MAYKQNEQDLSILCGSGQEGPAATHLDLAALPTERYFLSLSVSCLFSTLSLLSDRADSIQLALSTHRLAVWHTTVASWMNSRSSGHTLNPLVIRTKHWTPSDNN